MRNFKRASIFLMAMILLQALLHANNYHTEDDYDKHSRCFFRFYNIDPSECRQEYKIIRNAYLDYLNTLSWYQSVSPDASLYNWLKKLNSNNNSQEFNKHQLLIKENEEIEKDLICLRNIIDRVRCLTYRANYLTNPFFGYKNLLDCAEKNGEPNKVLKKRIERQIQFRPKRPRLKVDVERDDWSWKEKW